MAKSSTSFKNGHPGWGKGEKRPLAVREAISRKNKGKHIGAQNPKWKGGVSAGRYITIYSGDHPYRNKYGRVFEHRLVMERHIGRVLLPTEVVHHVNGIKDDNRIENLMLFSSHGDHLKFEMAQRRKNVRT